MNQHSHKAENTLVFEDKIRGLCKLFIACLKGFPSFFLLNSMLNQYFGKFQIKSSDF